MVKRMICIGMLLVMSFAITGCDGTGEDWHALIDELQKRTERQDDRISELEEENGRYAEKLKQLEEENKALEDRIKELEKPVCTCYLLEPDIKAAFDFTDPKDKPLDLTDVDFDGKYFYSIVIIFLKIREGVADPILELRHFQHPMLDDFAFLEKQDWRHNRPTAHINFFVEDEVPKTPIAFSLIRYFEAQCFVKAVRLEQLIVVDLPDGDIDEE